MPTTFNFGELGQATIEETIAPDQIPAFLEANGADMERALLAKRQEMLGEQTRQEFARAPDTFVEQVGSAAAQLGRGVSTTAGGALRGMGTAMAMSPVSRGIANVALAALGTPAGGGLLAGTVPAITPEATMRAVGALAAPYQAAGEAIQQAGKDLPVLPFSEQTVPGQLAEGVGTTVALAPSALAGPAGPFVAGAAYGMAAGQSAADDANQTLDRRIAELLAVGDWEGARALEASRQDVASAAFATAAPIGAATEAALGVTAGFVGKTPLARRATEAIANAAARRVGQRVASAAGGAVTGGVSEALQESSESLLGDVAASLVYDPGRQVGGNLLAEGALGGGVGALLGGLRGAVVGRTPRAAPPSAPARQAPTGGSSGQGAANEEAPIVEGGVPKPSPPRTPPQLPPPPTTTPPQLPPPTGALSEDEIAELDTLETALEAGMLSDEQQVRLEELRAKANVPKGEGRRVIVPPYTGPGRNVIITPFTGANRPALPGRQQIRRAGVAAGMFSWQEPQTETGQRVAGIDPDALDQGLGSIETENVPSPIDEAIMDGTLKRQLNLPDAVANAYTMAGSVAGKYLNGENVDESVLESLDESLPSFLKTLASRIDAAISRNVNEREIDALIGLHGRLTQFGAERRNDAAFLALQEEQRYQAWLESRARGNGSTPTPPPTPPAPTTPQPSGQSTLLNKDEQAQIEALRRQLRSEMANIGMGVNPQVFIIGVKMASVYVKAGVRKFEQYAREMKAGVPDLWERLKPHIGNMWNSSIVNVDDAEEVTPSQARAIVSEIDKPPGGGGGATRPGTSTPTPPPPAPNAWTEETMDADAQSVGGPGAVTPGDSPGTAVLDRPAGLGKVQVITGKPWMADAPRDPDVTAEGVWVLMEADDVVTSFQGSAYNQKIQPRVMDTVERQEKADEYGRDLRGHRLAESGTTDTGGIIIDEKAQAISGNNRLRGVRRAISGALGQPGLASMKRYKDWLRKNAASLGFTPEQVDSMRNPMAFRLALSYPNTTKLRFAETANDAPAISPTIIDAAVRVAEAIRKDPSILLKLNPSETGSMMVKQNEPFMRLVQSLSGMSEKFQDAQGNLNDQIEPFANKALLAYLFGSKDYRDTAFIIERAGDFGFRQAINGVAKNAGLLAQLAGTPYEIGSVFRDAFKAIVDIKSSGLSVEEYVDQATLGIEGKENPETKALVGVLMGIQSAKEADEVFKFYADSAQRAMKDLAVGGGLWGVSDIPGRPQILSVAAGEARKARQARAEDAARRKKQKEEEDAKAKEQGGRTEQGEGPGKSGVAPEGKGNPEGAGDGGDGKDVEGKKKGRRVPRVVKPKAPRTTEGRGKGAGKGKEPRESSKAVAPETTIAGQPEGEPPPTTPPEQPAKTPIQQAQDELGKAWDEFSANAKKLRITPKPAEDAVLAYKVFAALVKLAKAHIDNGVSKLADFAKATGLQINGLVTKAWDFAEKGLDPFQVQISQQDQIDVAAMPKFVSRLEGEARTVAAAARQASAGGGGAGRPPGAPGFDSGGTGRRRASRGLFKGRYETQSDDEWHKSAVAWVDAYGNDLEAAFADAQAGNPEYDMDDPKARGYVLWEIMRRGAEAEQNTADPRASFALNSDFIPRVAKAARETATQAGRALGAMNLAQARYSFLNPRLTLLGLIQERHRRLPFPNINSTEIREWLKGVRKRAVEAVLRETSQADNLVKRVFNRTAADLGVNWREVMESSFEVQRNVYQAIYQAILKHPILSTMPNAARIELANLLGKQFQAKRDEIAKREIARVVAPKASKKTAEAIIASIPRILKWANLGTLDDASFRDAVAPAFGVASFDSSIVQEITKMAQHAQAVGGENRNRILRQMYQKIQANGTIRFADALRDYWYASVLSGTRTQVDNAMNLANGFVKMAALGLAAPRKIDFFKAYLRGLGNGFRDFLPILVGGEFERSRSFDPERAPNALEAMAYASSRFARALSNAKYVSRLIAALDHLNGLGTYEAGLVDALVRTGDKAAIDAYLTPTATDLANARQVAINEGTPPERINARVREVLQEQLPAEVILDARALMQAINYTDQPKGIAGAVYRAMENVAASDSKAATGTGAGFAAKLITGTGFLRFAANLFNDYTDFMVVPAAVRWYTSRPGGVNEDAYRPVERRLLAAKAGIGGALAALAAALFLGDDDDENDRSIDITGSFKGIDPAKRKQLLAEGRKPYSIRVGDQYISYRQFGFGSVLGVIGELRDRQLFDRENWDNEGILSKWKDASAAGLLVVSDSTAISGLTEFLGASNAYKYDAGDVIDKKLPRFLARLAGSFVPNLVKEVDAWGEPSIFKAETGAEYFVQQVPFARRDVGPGPVLNVLGEPVAVERYPWSRWVSGRKEDGAWSTLGRLASEGVFLPTIGKRKVVNEDGTRRDMTREEEYRFQGAVGRAYRAFIVENRSDILSMPKAEAAAFIDRETERIRNRTAKEMFGY